MRGYETDTSAGWLTIEIDNSPLSLRASSFENVEKLWRNFQSVRVDPSESLDFDASD